MIALLLDPSDDQGRAGGTVLDDDAVGRIVAALSVGSAPLDVHVVRSPYATDARRLEALPPGDDDHVLVVRPPAALLPSSVLRLARDEARRRRLDIARLSAVPADVCYIASRRAVALLAEVGGVPGCVTIPDALDRLMAAGASIGDAALATGTVPALTPGDSRPLRIWRTPHLADLLAVPSEVRLDEAIRLRQQAFGDARADLHRLRARPPIRRRGMREDVLVIVASMYQSGAHAAWAELAGCLSPSRVAFLVGRGTALAQVLEARGFATIVVDDGLAPESARDAAVLMTALDDMRPRVAHFDGAEGSMWAATAFARGLRVVQHVRLNDADRFAPALVYADAVVGVSSHVCDLVRARVGSAVRVEHVPDGVCLDARAVRPDAVPAPNAERPFLCLCLGRVEPAKGQLRVLDVFEALRQRVRCRLVLIGPCGRDAAYCDEVRDRIEAQAVRGDITWEPFRYPVDDLYAAADVVLVGSRNEALGMVGLEALAAGVLLVAQRTTGYEAILDPSKQEGLLFERDEPAAAIADRIVVALGAAASYGRNGRRKVEARFDARATAGALERLWQEIAALR